MRARTSVILLIVIPALVFVGASGVEAKTRGPKIATGPMDDGTLDPFFFGKGLEFCEVDKLDYLWVKEGFAFPGQTLHFVSWPEPVFRGESAEDRDEEDHRLARMLNGEMARTFSEVFGDEIRGVTTSLEAGNVVVEGRIVDCSTGSSTAKILVGFGAGSGNTTIDLKFTDRESGELLVAMHHRVVSGTSWSTTEGKFTKWISKLAREINKVGLGELYADGDPTNK